MKTISDIRKHINGRKKNKLNNINDKILKYSSINIIDNIKNKKTSGNNSIDINKENIIKLNYLKNIANCEDTQNNIKINKEFPSIALEDANKVSDIDKKEEIEKEENFGSTLNRKSIRTQVNKKVRQESIQRSDKAEISKIISESDKVTDSDNKTKILFRLNPYNKHSINEKKEIENELIGNYNNKDIIYESDNDKKEEKEEGNFIKPNIIKKDNFLIEEKNIKINNKDNNTYNIIKINEIENDKKENNEKLLINENISERKNLIPIMYPNIMKGNLINENTPKRENKNDKNIQISNNKTQTKLMNIISNKEEKLSQTSSISMTFFQLNCFICEKKSFVTKFYCAECKTHFLCRRCLKNYYEDYLENKRNNNILFCPSTKCGKKINYEIIKPIISETHQQMFELSKNNNISNKDLNYINLKLGSEENDNNLKKYTDKHVVDINSNKNFFMFKKSKEIFCPKCLNPTLFSKTNNHFIKCLNCNYKICKYCLKEFTEIHLDIKVEGYCKVYFRRKNEMNKKINNIKLYLINLFFVIVMYLFTFFGAYLFFLTIFKILFFLDNKKINFIYYIKKTFIMIFTISFFIISFPIIVVCCPFFPNIIALCDI